MTAPDDIQSARAWLTRDDQYPEDWCEWLTDDIEATLLRALDALEHEESVAANTSEVAATLASCDRARRAAEEECERLRAEVECVRSNWDAAHRRLVGEIAALTADIRRALAGEVK